MQDLNLTCPQSAMLLYKDENFEEYLSLVEGNASLQAFPTISSIIVLGDQAWLLHFSLAVPKFLFPGKYATPEEAGVGHNPPYAAEPYIPTISVTNIMSPSKDTCIVDDSLKLFDDDPSTCMTVEEVLTLTITSTEPLHQLAVLTSDMDCAKSFHVSVGVRRPANQCYRVDKGVLIGTAYDYEDGSVLSGCVFSVPRGEGNILIKLVTLQEAHICSVTAIND